MKVDVISKWIVKISKDTGKPYPVSKAIEGDKKVETKVTVTEKDGCQEISTEELSVKLSKDGYVDIFDKNGMLLCEDYRGERKKSTALDEAMAMFMEMEGHSVSLENKEKATQIVKKIEGSECFYGLGDKTGFMDKRGYAYTTWNTDNPDPQLDHFRSLYKSIPFLIVKREDCVYGLFFDCTFRSDFDLGKESAEYFVFETEEENLEYYFIGGESLKDVIKGYTYLTGTAPLPQIWTLGYHQSRWGYRCEEDIREIAENMRKHELPCDAIHMDIDYMDRYKVFTVDPKRFPDLKELTSDLRKDGLRLVTIMDPGVKLEEGYSIYEEGIKNGYFATEESGEVYVNAVWPGDAVFPDFGRKEVREWWGENHKELLEDGIAGIWNDMNEPASFRGELPPGVVFYDEERKSNHAEIHNVYGHNMARATYQGIKKLTGKRPFVITRACYSGSQKYTTAWTGDNHSIWAHLQMAIPQLCNLGMSGMPLVGTDIGGFGSDTTKELLCRWIQLGCFSPFCRNHSAAGTRVQEPWQFDEETIDIYRKYLQLRYKMIPYFYDCLKEEEETGLPLMRPMVLNYENDPETFRMHTQFMVGDRMIVAPVIEQGATHKMVYLPEGEWYDYWDGEKVQGGRYIVRPVSLWECPIYVKAGTVLPQYSSRLSMCEEKDETLILKIYPGEGEYIHYQDNGEDFAYREGEYNLYRFKLQGEQLTMSLDYKGYSRVYKNIIVSYKNNSKMIAWKNEQTIEIPTKM